MRFEYIVSFGLLLATSVANDSLEDASALASTDSNVVTKPNFLFIMTDDQDLKLNSLSYTPLTMKHMAKKGTTFSNHFITTALCCPSRVSLLTGRLSHNTNVTDVNPPWGGYPKFIAQGFNDNYLPVWLQQAGYDTYYTGKLMNSHSLEYYNKPHAAGFNGSDFVLDPYTYDYMNATYQRNHDQPVSYLGRHTTEVLREKSLGFLNDALAGERPFFLTVTPIAPHSNMNGTYGGGAGPLWMDEPIPEERHKHLFPDAKVPRTANFNPKEPTGVSWIHDLPYRNQSVVDYNDHYYRQRLRALQGVDELVDNLITRLEQSGKINNTFIIYTSDNGFHISQHRLPPGKTCGFEEDIRVPFMIRGPGILENHIDETITTHIDIAPTLFELAGLPLRSDFDGTPMPTSKPNEEAHEHVTVEFWGRGMLEGGLSNLGVPTVPNNTYKAVRVLADEYNLFFSVWCNNEHELYDLTADPYQVNNLWKKDLEEIEVLGYAMSEVVPRLDALLMVLKSCRGSECVKPWGTLHPDGSVTSLKGALDPKFNSFYHSQPKVSFDRCVYGYEIDAEGPQEAFAYKDGYSLESWV
ncbi:Alkaline phosphatase-like alpha/beta/alpha [Penicillium verrucosum]|uniref:Alkaline phosphatase-like alpha/beta/alpha n=1 Tax=Penicillium verrucosum TaxID=60171 RepID=UPI002545913B|nr:Alkaline phosphatase-like alpha/beta/alpha [Penicillium verrucosum]KAJ5942185.1 Alkaline phosphatase-like alpha/beta/alpha [Penicillium verrucosum]